jgi:proline iminopeptidase
MGSPLFAARRRLSRRVSRRLSAVGFTLVLAVAAAALTGGPHRLSAASDALYPPIEPTATGTLEVSERHTLAWETCGNEDGVPVIVLHGGPGGGCNPEMRRFFDPARHRMILFDQRGGGRSRPAGEWRENTTKDLVEDIQRIRAHLGVEGKAILFGGSWGTTLALAYAEEHPELVRGLLLRGVFLATREEIDHFYHGGAALFFPDAFERLRSALPHPERRDYPRQLFEMTQSDDAAVRERAVREWARYEIRMAYLDLTDEACASILERVAPDRLRAFSVLENHYMMQGCFLEEGQLLEGASKIAEIPTYIVNGRYDVICPPRTAHALAARLERVRLELPVAGHSQSEAANIAALVRGARWLSAEGADP